MSLGTSIPKKLSLLHCCLATLSALLSENLIGWLSGRIAPSCPMDQLLSYETRQERAANQTIKRLCVEASDVLVNK